MDLSLVRKLNDSNEKIDIAHNFKIVAGPGAGKTSFLVNHIQNIIGTSSKITNLRKVACITYTNVGVEAIIHKLGNTTDYVEVSTIHSFLYQHVVKPYLWVLNNEFEFDYQNINGHDEIIPTHGLLEEWKQKTSQFYLKDMKKVGSKLIKLHWFYDDGRLVLRFKNKWDSQIDSYSIKSSSYIEYKKICWKRGMISHDDILYLSHRIIQKCERILDVLRAKFPYILVDEFQDTNPIQAELLKWIAKKETIIGVIGDECQSIYKFQGADVHQFAEFKLPKLRTYLIEDNHRCTQEIIDVLNYMRNDKAFLQKTPENKHGDKPQILVGNFFNAYKKAIDICDGNDVYTLSFKNELSNTIQYGVDSYFVDNITDELIFSDNDRGRMIFFTVKSIEYCLQKKFKDAIKLIKKAYRKIENFNDKQALENLKRLCDKYDTIRKLSIKDFYNNYLFGLYGVKQKITRGKACKYYINLPYKKVACVVNISDDDSKFRTIHKAKGEEFKNVLVLLPPSDNYEEEKNLSFLIKPDMNDESHRVYYVALSRAMKNLFISVPQISLDNRRRLNKLFDFIDL